MADDLTIYIPTFRRTDRQRTWDQISPRWRNRTFLVVRPDEERVMRDQGYPVLVLDDDVPAGISPTRQWIVDQHDTDLLGPNIIMMDDDLYFFQRRDDDPTKFLRVEPHEHDIFDDMMAALEEMFQFTPLVGLASRAGANRNTEPYLLNTRVYGCWGINVDVMRAEGFRVDRTVLMQDFDLHLQFMERGYPLLVLNSFCKDDRGSNSEGGVSEIRNDTVHAETAHLLASLHPAVVTVREAVAWKGMGTRTDVTVQWKKAFDAGEKARRLAGERLHPVPVWDQGFLDYESS